MLNGTCSTGKQLNNQNVFLVSCFKMVKGQAVLLSNSPFCVVSMQASVRAKVRFGFRLIAVHYCLCSTYFHSVHSRLKLLDMYPPHLVLRNKKHEKMTILWTMKHKYS